MDMRLQVVNDDTILEITEDKPHKRRLSEKTLLATRDSLLRSIERFQTALAEVDASLAMIAQAKHEDTAK